jgi:four helix bundle protein
MKILHVVGARPIVRRGKGAGAHGRQGDGGTRSEAAEGKMETGEWSVVRFISALPKNKVTNVLGYQLLKSGTSIGANYREANQAESRKDFIHKIALVEKEAAETQYWLELCIEADIGNPEERQWLLQESGELLAIFTSNRIVSKGSWQSLQIR